MSVIAQIQRLIRNGLYYLTEHADDRAMSYAFDIYDIEHSILTGRIRRTWPQTDKYEIIGKALDGRTLGIVCRITQGDKVRVITVYEDNQKEW